MGCGVFTSKWKLYLQIPPGTVAIERNLSTLQVFQPESEYQTMGSTAMIKPETNKVYPYVYSSRIIVRVAIIALENRH